MQVAMELSQPRPKKHCKLSPSCPLPISFKKDGSIRKIKANFNGFSVTVSEPEDMKQIISMGYFGKANFSRSYPNFTREGKVQIVRKRQFKNRENCFKKFTSQGKPEKLLTVPDSESDDDDYFTNLQPKYEMDYSGIKEDVWLSPEEAFFLSSSINCLEVQYKGETMDVENMWNRFTQLNQHFKRNYVAYYYFRAKNWVVKPGIKFGGDFLLYKQGPPFYHASYVVVIEVVDQNNQTIKCLTNRSMDNVSVLALNRLCETAGKELLICRIKWPENNEIYYANMSNICIQEILISRWICSQEREECKGSK